MVKDQQTATLTDTSKQAPFVCTVNSPHMEHSKYGMKFNPVLTYIYILELQRIWVSAIYPDILTKIHKNIFCQIINEPYHLPPLCKLLSLL